MAFTLCVIQDLLKVLRAERERLSTVVEQSLAWDETGEQYADCSQSLAFMEVACSQAEIGAVASLAETLMHRIAARLRQHFTKPSGANAHHRSNLSDDDFWNPSLLARRKDDPDTNIVAGFRQLLKALGQSTKISKESWSMLEAIFAYRNSALHQGYEWPAEGREAFLKQAVKENWKWYDDAKQDGNPWLISIKDEFWPEAIAQIENIARIMHSVCKG
ncbi:MAG: hypothetical protein IT427_11460 [Pirellulales bacterium]|nr:hypothetical protein [Pirellulales bacterium]